MAQLVLLLTPEFLKKHFGTVHRVAAFFRMIKPSITFISRLHSCDQISCLREFQIIALTLVIFAVVNGDSTFANDLKLVGVNYNGRGLIYADNQQLWMSKA